MASLYKKPVFRKDPKTGERVKGKSKKWWAQYRDELGILRRKPLSVDKAAALAGSPAGRRTTLPDHRTW